MIDISRALIAATLLSLVLASAAPQSSANQGRHQANTATVHATRNHSPATNAVDDFITITSGKIQITAPRGWKTAENLNDSADFQAVDTANGLYLIVLTDNKVDYVDMTLEKHSMETLAVLIKPLTSIIKSGPIRFKINGNPAVQYEVRGTIQGLNVVYLHTTVETSAHYQQIVTWQLVSSFESKKQLMQGIINSFREI